MKRAMVPVMDEATIREMERTPGVGRPVITCFVGSTRFKAEFEKRQAEHTLAGEIVLTVGFYHHADAIPITEAQKHRVDELHLRKIELADEVLVINPGGYIGESGRREILHARKLGKRIVSIEPLPDDLL